MQQQKDNNKLASAPASPSDTVLPEMTTLSINNDDAIDDDTDGNDIDRGVPFSHPEGTFKQSNGVNDDFILPPDCHANCFNPDANNKIGVKVF